MSFAFRGDRTALLQRVARGTSPNEFLYGLPFFDDPRLAVGYVEDAHPYVTPVERALRPFQELIGWRYRIGFNLHAYWKNRHELSRADAIVTTTDSYGLPILWRARSGALNARVVYISQGLHWLVERAARSGVDELVRRVVGGWLRAAAAVVVLGDGDAAFMRDAFGQEGLLPLRTIQFGVDEAFWTPADMPADGPMLAVGSDALRDWPTLLRAAGERPLRLVTRLPVNAALRGARTVVDGAVDDAQLRDLYRRAGFVVIPVEETRRDAGHSATLQAMACGKAVILSRTQGLWDPIHMVDGDTCLMVVPGDVADLRRAIDRLEADPAEAAAIGHRARALVERMYTAKAFGLAMQETVRDALALR